ncbi:MAG: hypothetical protein EOO68_09950, partial [Moraxellaceae bacterium]
MKKSSFKILGYTAVLASLSIAAACSDDDTATVAPVNPVTEGRFITVAGALMQDEAGDGSGGTMVYSMTKEEARNPECSINVYESG